MPETAQTCLEYLFATGQVDKSVVFWNTAWCAAGESGLCRCESESQNCLWQCLTGCHPLLTVLVGESVPITTAISPIATVSAVDEWLFGGLAILRTEMDDLRVSWSARGYRHPSSVSDAGQSVMCWRGLVARRVLALFLSECSLFRAREVDCEWEGSHDVIMISSSWKHWLFQTLQETKTEYLSIYVLLHTVFKKTYKYLSFIFWYLSDIFITIWHFIYVWKMIE